MDLRRLAAVAATLALLVGALAGGSPAAADDGATPAVAAHLPIDQSEVEAGAPLEASGTYDAPQGVAAVRIVIFHRDTARYLTPEGGWSEVWTPHLATLSAPGAASGDYSFTWDGGFPLPGGYRVATNIVDVAGGASHVQRYLTVRETPVGTPTVVVHTPAEEIPEQDTTVPLQASGTYHDDAGVAAVRLLVVHLPTGHYLAPDGSWTTQWTPHPTVLSDPGATTGSYSLTGLTLPLAGMYRVGTNVLDLDGNVAHVQRYVSVVDPPPPPGGHATVMFGRSGWEGAEDCVPYPGSVDLEEAVAWLHDELGISAVGGVVAGYTGDTERTCQGYITYPTWDDLARLRDTYGTVFVSQSQTYGGWARATTTEAIRAESCDTLATFAAQGHDRAWGMFNYPNDGHTPAQEAVVASCFAFGRLYGVPGNDAASVLAPPHIVRTTSVTSGKCNNPDLACYDIPVKNDRRYTLPEDAAAFFDAAPGQYAVNQFYRFVSGARLTGGDTTWDCTSPDPRDHWVTRPEVYCFEDFQAVMREVAGDVTFTDPATVAELWGRIPTS